MVGKERRRPARLLPKANPGADGPLVERSVLDSSNSLDGVSLFKADSPRRSQHHSQSLAIVQNLPAYANAPAWRRRMAERGGLSRVRPVC